MLSILAQTNLWSAVPVGEHLMLCSPLLALIATMLAVVALPLVVGRGARTTAGLVLLGVAASLVLTLMVAGRVATSAGHSILSTSLGDSLLLVDNLSVGFQVILFVFLLAVIGLWWMGSLETEKSAPEFFILLLGSALGMAFMTSTANLLMIVIAIETASLPSYAIVGFDKKDRAGAEASLKYMIFGAVCAAIMLYGASLIYGLVGSLQMDTIARYALQEFASSRPPLLLMVAFLCFLAGILFKISAVPFHFWCPDAFEGAKVEVTTWLSVVSKAAGLILLARIVMIFSAAVTQPAAMDVLAPIAWTIGIIAAITCTVGNFSAYMQNSVKRLLAYSSIAHAGYMMMAAAVFLHPDTANAYAGMTALLAYVVIYLFMNLGAFGIVALVQWDSGSDKIEAFTGLIRRAPWLTIPMVICLVSLVGLPPFAGFFGKWWILLALGQMGGILGWSLVVVASVNTLISLYFYMRIVVQMTLRDDGRPAVRAPMGGIALVNAAAVMLLVLFVYAAPLKTQAERYTHGLFMPPVEVREAKQAAANSQRLHSGQ